MNSCAQVARHCTALGRSGPVALNTLGTHIFLLDAGGFLSSKIWLYGDTLAVATEGDK